MMSAFANAGIRLAQMDRVQGPRLIEAYEVFFNNPTKENFEIMTTLEVEFQKMQEYDCMAEKGNNQVEWLKALDFSDQWTENLCVFNVCQAKLPGHRGTCGLCIPAKLWEQPDAEQWKFLCGVDWEKLLLAAEKNPEDEKPSKWVSALAEEHGNDLKDWPRIGCNAKFVPWARGPSKALQFRAHKSQCLTNTQNAGLQKK